MDTRKKNADWKINIDFNGKVTVPDAQLAVLMDIRSELQSLNRVFACRNFQEMPDILRDIKRKTRARFDLETRQRKSSMRRKTSKKLLKRRRNV